MVHLDHMKVTFIGQGHRSQLNVMTSLVLFGVKVKVKLGKPGTLRGGLAGRRCCKAHLKGPELGISNCK